nr:PREDICTED: CD48 antigen-like [Lepisosteus oculatus]
MSGIRGLLDFNYVLAVSTLLQVFQLSVKVSHSLVVNGTLGQSVVLPSGVDEKTYNSVNPDIVQWERNREYIIQFLNQVKSLESNNFKGRLTVSPTDGSLTVSPLRGEDEGEYVFSGTGSGSFPEHRVTLRVYEKIRGVQIHHEKSYGEQNTSCNLTLHCNVTGGTDVNIHWLRDGSKNPEQLGSAAVKLVLHPTDGDLTYTCVASNPVSSRSATVDANKCYTQG